MKIKVGVFFGGRSVEHEVSIISAIQAINAIDKQKYNVIPIYITKQGVWYTGEPLLNMANYKDIDKLLAKCQQILLPVNSDQPLLLNYPIRLFKKQVINQIDVAFPIFHGTHGEDGAIQGLFELINLPYVGCDVLGSAVGMNKIVMKQMLKSASFPIVNHVWFYTKEWLKNKDSLIERAEKLTYPLIVKPATLGSSIGISKVNNRQELEEAVEVARRFSQQLLIEAAVSNLTEINCSVLGDYDKTEVSVCEEPISGDALLSFQDKYISDHQKTTGMSGAKRKLPADIPEDTTELIKELAKQTFQLVNGCGVARVDFLVIMTIPVCMSMK